MKVLGVIISEDSAFVKSRRDFFCEKNNYFDAANCIPLHSSRDVLDEGTLDRNTCEHHDSPARPRTFLVPGAFLLVCLEITS